VWDFEEHKEVNKMDTCKIRTQEGRYFKTSESKVSSRQKDQQRSDTQKVKTTNRRTSIRQVEGTIREHKRRGLGTADRTGMRAEKKTGMRTPEKQIKGHLS
jgi:hypothetical protein